MTEQENDGGSQNIPTEGSIPDEGALATDTPDSLIPLDPEVIEAKHQHSDILTAEDVRKYLEGSSSSYSVFRDILLKLCSKSKFSTSFINEVMAEDQNRFAENLIQAFSRFKEDILKDQPLWTRVFMALGKDLEEARHLFLQFRKAQLSEQDARIFTEQLQPISTQLTDPSLMRRKPLLLRNFGSKLNQLLTEGVIHNKPVDQQSSQQSSAEATEATEATEAHPNPDTISELVRSIHDRGIVTSAQEVILEKLLARELGSNGLSESEQSELMRLKKSIEDGKELQENLRKILDSFQTSSQHVNDPRKTKIKEILETDFVIPLNRSEPEINREAVRECFRLTINISDAFVSAAPSDNDFSERLCFSNPHAVIKSTGGFITTDGLTRFYHNPLIKPLIKLMEEQFMRPRDVGGSTRTYVADGQALHLNESIVEDVENLFREQESQSDGAILPFSANVLLQFSMLIGMRQSLVLPIYADYKHSPQYDLGKIFPLYKAIYDLRAKGGNVSTAAYQGFVNCIPSVKELAERGKGQQSVKILLGTLEQYPALFSSRLNDKYSPESYAKFSFDPTNAEMVPWAPSLLEIVKKRLPIALEDYSTAVEKLAELWDFSANPPDITAVSDITTTLSTMVSLFSPTKPIYMILQSKNDDFPGRFENYKQMLVSKFQWLMISMFRSYDAGAGFSVRERYNATISYQDDDVFYEKDDDLYKYIELSPSKKSMLAVDPVPGIFILECIRTIYGATTMPNDLREEILIWLNNQISVTGEFGVFSRPLVKTTLWGFKSLEHKVQVLQRYKPEAK